MTAVDTNELEEEQPKKSKLPLIIGVALALVLGGAGFLVANSGLLHPDPMKRAMEQAKEPAAPAPVFQELDPMLISLGPTSRHDYLRFQAQIEVNSTYAAEVAAIKPRIVDVLNGYLRAIEPDDLEEPSALIRLRAQMLRRLQIVAGPDRIKDLLVMEFVLN